MRDRTLWSWQASLLTSQPDAHDAPQCESNSITGSKLKLARRDLKRARARDNPDKPRRGGGHPPNTASSTRAQPR